MSNKMGVDFNGPQPIPIVSEVTETECSASICNQAGQLLFYTDSKNIYHANGTIMFGGNDIAGIGNASLTTSQGALIVPDPGNPSRYYVFTLARQLYLNVVDMSLNNGNGAVVLNHPQRGMICNDTLAEKMIAIKGCEKNIWVICHGNTRTEFLSFEVTVNKVDTVPVVSTVGFSAPGAYFQGEMKADPEGKRIIACKMIRSDGTELYNFDHVSGTVYNAVIIDTVGTYGAAFSPDGSKLYLCDWNTYKFLQYDLNNNYAKTELGNAQGTTKVRLAVDGKIYFVAEEGSFTNIGFGFLGRINNPNAVGTACQFQAIVPTLTFPNSNSTGLRLCLPNEVVVIGSEHGGGLYNRLMLDTSFCANEPLVDFALEASPGFSNYQWENGATGTGRNVTASGTYWVSYMTQCGRRTDTFKVNANALPPIQFEYNAPILSVTNSYHTYQWYKDGQLLVGETNATLSATDTGWYSLIVTNVAGCADSAFYRLSGATAINVIEDAVHVSVYPNPVQDILYINANVPLQLCLTDIQGRLMATTSSSQIDMRRLVAGLYILNIRQAKTGQLVAVRKIVK